MSSYINLFLKTEITCIPRLISKYIGNYYNNALCNGATWLFLFWCILHLIFDKFLNAFLRKIRYKQYICNRLVSSLWYFGFYGAAFVYCGATLVQNEIELFNFKKMNVPSETNLPLQLLGYTLMSTFYFHSAFWEGLKNGSLVQINTYFLLALFLTVSYILRIVETSFTLTALISIAQITIEFTRCFAILSKRDSFIVKIAIGSMFAVTFSIFLAIYLFVIPLTYVVPMGLNIMSDYPNTLLIILFFLIVIWLTAELYNSIVFKFVNHWLYHTKEVENPQCCGSIIDCSLFAPRDDISFNLNILRQEIKAREAQMMSKRKPKNRGMLIQTLKCMVAIKRKLSEKRKSDSSDADESEKPEYSNLNDEETSDLEVLKFEKCSKQNKFKENAHEDLEENDFSDGLVNNKEQPKEIIDKKELEEVNNEENQCECNDGN